MSLGNDRGIMIAGGTLNLHGDRTNSWTKLAGTAKAGSARIEVLNASGWRKGDVIVLALDRLRFHAGGEANHRRHCRERDHA